MGKRREMCQPDVYIPAEAPTEAPPDGGYGWVVCGAISWGVAASYGVYLSHYLASDYFPGATSLDYALIGGIKFGVVMVISPFLTVLTRELGRHVVMTAGAIMISGGNIAASFASQILQLYLSQGVLIGLGIGALFIPSVQLLPQWFHKKRSVAQGIMSAGSGVGGLAFSLGTDAMIKNISLACALRITGLICLVANMIATLLIKDRNHIVKPPQLSFAVHLLKRYDCLLLLAWSFINLMGYMIILYSLSPYAVYIGLSQAQASVLTALLNLGTGIGRPCIGIASDYFGRIQTAAVLTVACAWAILGTFWMTIGSLCAQVAGLKEVPSFLSLAWPTAVLPTTFAEVIALYVRRPDEPPWGYLYPQIFGGLAYGLASLFLIELWRVTKKKRREATARNCSIEALISIA